MMEQERVTPCEIGAIFHRARTELQEGRRCRNGHDAPRYVSRACVACAKLRVVLRIGRVHPVRRFANYAEARAAHEERGGWLLVHENGCMLVTQSLHSAQRLRSAAWLAVCENLECWDEVELRRMGAV